MRLVLNKKLYKVAAVKAAAEAFAGLARVTVKAEAGALSVTFSDLAQDAGSELADEFLNYALAETIATRG